MDAHIALCPVEGHEHRVALLLVVGAVVQRLAKQAPLHGEIRDRVRVHDAVHTPRGGEVIEDDVPEDAALIAKREGMGER